MFHAAVAEKIGWASSRRADSLRWRDLGILAKGARPGAGAAHHPLNAQRAAPHWSEEAASAAAASFAAFRRFFFCQE